MFKFEFREEDLFFQDKIKIRDDLYLKNLKVSDIFKFGESYFFKFIEFFTLHPHQVASELDDAGMNFKEFKTDFDFFIYNFGSSYLFEKNENSYSDKSVYEYKKKIYELFEYFLDMKDIQIIKKIKDKSEIFLLRDTSGKEIDVYVFFDIANILRKITNTPIEKCPKFKNKRAMEMWIKLERRRKNNKNNNKSVNTRKLISKVVVSQKTTYEYVYNLFYAQFKDIIDETSKLYEYMAVNNAIFNNCDLSKIKMDKYHWLN